MRPVDNMLRRLSDWWIDHAAIGWGVFFFVAFPLLCLWLHHLIG